MKHNFLYLLITFLLLFVNIKSEQCHDKSCDRCTKDGSYCFQCKPNFIRHYSRCGKTCKTIQNCWLCNEEETSCVKCYRNCRFNGKYCDCTERLYILVICSIFTISFIAIVIYCLVHPTFRLTVYPIMPNISIFNNYRTRNQLAEESTVEATEIFPCEIELNKEFEKLKINLKNVDIENKKCDLCNSNLCNLLFGCGCYVCFDCEKKCVVENKCLKCKSNLSTMQQVSCSICYNNKREISTFNCQCKTVVCKECYVKWRKKNKTCPSCRNIILPIK